MEVNVDEISKSNNKETDIFEYETENLALKGNKDYAQLIQCLSTLTAIRSQALADIDIVLQLEDDALADPLEFVRKLKNGEDLGIPNRLDVPEIPTIDWRKYKIQPPNDALRPITRPKQRETACEDKSFENGVVRGRKKEEGKPATFNKLWTPEEQLKLEELLGKYPPESNEARRFAKIAKELGNRSLSQVTSRCQKYFVKLQKAGMPIPGRAPRLRYKEHVKNPRAKFSPLVGSPMSTFFPRSFLPVSMDSDEDLPGTLSVDVSYIKSEPLDSEESNTSDATSRISDETRKLNLLRRVRADLSRHSGQIINHPGFMCNICKEEPLTGTRWHCLQCNDVDFCSSCLIDQFEAEIQHPLDHQLVSYRPAISQGVDKDYAQSLDYNYLDSNFQPD